MHRKRKEKPEKNAILISQNKIHIINYLRGSSVAVIKIIDVYYLCKTVLYSGFWPSSNQKRVHLVSLSIHNPHTICIQNKK